MQIRPKLSSPRSSSLDYSVTNDLYLGTIESCPDTIFVLGDGREVSHRSVEMSNVLQRSYFHILMLLVEHSGYAQRDLLFLGGK